MAGIRAVFVAIDAVAVAQLPGDVNFDRAMVASELDRLTADVLRGNNDLSFDLNMDGKLDEEDRRY